MGRHPYRHAEEPLETPNARARGFDGEDWIVHGLLLLVGVLGIFAGLFQEHPIELTLGAFITWFTVKATIAEHAK